MSWLRCISTCNLCTHSEHPNVLVASCPFLFHGKSFPSIGSPQRKPLRSRLTSVPTESGSLSSLGSWGWNHSDSTTAHQKEYKILFRLGTKKLDVWAIHTQSLNSGPWKSCTLRQINQNYKVSSFRPFHIQKRSLPRGLHIVSSTCWVSSCSGTSLVAA